MRPVRLMKKDAALHPEGRWLKLALAAAMAGLILARVAAYMTQDRCEERGGRWSWSERTCRIALPISPNAKHI